MSPTEHLADAQLSFLDLAFSSKRYLITRYPPSDDRGYRVSSLTSLAEIVIEDRHLIMPLINYTLLRTGVGTLPGHFTTRADVYQAGKGCGKTMPPNNFPEPREWLRQCRLLGHTPFQLHDPACTYFSFAASS